MNIFHSPKIYEDASFLTSETMEGIWERLGHMTLQPQTILDVGCGTGRLSHALQERYPQAATFGVDLSDEMIGYAKTHSPISAYVQARARHLPFASASMDIVVANLLLPWIMDIKAILQECRRVLKSNGLFLCTALGPDTLQEIRAAAQHYQVVNLIDMHDLGDLLMQVGLIDPVLEVSYVTANYREPTNLIRENMAIGILGPDTPLSLELNQLAISFEMVYGHAFAPIPSTKSERGEVKISLKDVRKTLKESNQLATNLPK